ncbi:MAG: hypothetical protein M1820_008990 [Bogoriella megaspora]|nr:MAG: hypothetical protein M1820_008990 [Bogoriella megaspora]
MDDFNSYGAYNQSPPANVQEPGYGGRDDMGRNGNDAYRRRSPDRRGGVGRRRSRSPQIDRYQPDRSSREDLYGNRDRSSQRRRRSSPPAGGTIDRYVPGQDSQAPVIMANPLPNPMTLDFQVGFTWYSEWWRRDQSIKEEKERQKTGERRPAPIRGEREMKEEQQKEREKIQASYDTYKEKLQIKMAHTFVQQHKGEDWFRERYDRDRRAAFHAKLSEFRRGLYATWERDLEAGTFDEFTLEGIYKGDSNGVGGVVEKEEGETVAAAEVLGVGDLLPLRGGDIRDEVAMQPTLLVKTIAPTVNRDKMEEWCKEHLGEGQGGFKWLSLSDPNPQKRCHRMGWIILNTSKEQESKEEGGEAKGEEEAMAEDGVVADEDENDTRTTSEKALAEINGKTIHDEEHGDFTCHVGVHKPPEAPRKKALWDLFSAPERIERDLQLATRLVQSLDADINSGINGVEKVEQRVEYMRSKGWLQPPITTSSASKKAKKDPDDMDEGEDESMEEGEEGEEGEYDDEVDDEELLAKKKTLDLLVEYLRRVFNFCFFCVFESDSVHEMMRKCPGGHLRRPRASLTSAAKAAAQASATNEPFPLKKETQGPGDTEEGSPVDERKQSKSGGKNSQQLLRAFNWVRTYEDKLMQILEPENVDIRKIGGKPLEEGVEEELAKYVKQEDEAKFRCKLELVNSYVLDPAHIAPSKSDATSNGHFAVNNHTQTGTPRGFNLASMQQFGLPGGLPAGLPNPAVFQGMLGQHSAAIPGTWGPPGADFAGDDRHQGGAIRRQGNRFNNRANGPYDRQPRDARNARWNPVSGRLTPPRGTGGRGGGNRLREGEAATMGPREAVQGRSLKSYEDLDAVNGNANGELDY